MKILAQSAMVLLVAVGLVALPGTLVMAQGQPPAQTGPTVGGGPGGGNQGPGGGDRGPGGRRGDFDPAQMRERLMGRMKEALEATDEEWKVIEPRIQKVMEAQPMPRFGGMGRMRGQGGPGPGDQGGPGDRGDQRGPGGPPEGRGRFFGASLPEADGLEKVVDAKDSTNDQIKAALKAYRGARDKQEKDLEKARQDLREVLSLRQEARLVLFRVLD